MKKTNIFSELRKEFAGSVYRLRSIVQLLCRNHPKLWLTSMGICTIASVVLCFSVLRENKSVQNPIGMPVKTFGSGLTEMSVAASQLKTLIELQAALKMYLAKDSLTSQDSLAMEHMLNTMENIQKPKHATP